MKLTTLLLALCFCFLSWGICEAQYFTLPGNFSYSVNPVNQVMDVSPDGKMAVALRSDGHPVLTTFEPVSGQVFDTKTFGFGPEAVQLVKIGSGLRAAVLTNEGGPFAIYLFDIGPAGQLTQLSKTSLTTSNAAADPTLVLSSAAQVGFTIIFSADLTQGQELISFSLIDGTVLSRFPLKVSTDEPLTMYEANGKRMLAFVRSTYASGKPARSVGLVDASNPVQMVDLGIIPLPENLQADGAEPAGLAFSSDGKYLFVGARYSLFSTIDLSTNQVVASLPNYQVSRVRIYEDGQRRLLALRVYKPGPVVQSFLVLVDATDPLILSVLTQTNFTSNYKSDYTFTKDGSLLIMAEGTGMTALKVPSLNVAWKQQLPNSTALPLQIIAFGQDVIGTWHGNGALSSISLFGTFPVVPPNVSISDDISVTESSTATANFNVTLSAPTTHRVTVAYSTPAGTATQNSDYVNTNGTLTFEPGETTKMITIPILDDKLDEFDETFTVKLLSASVGILQRALATCTILDDTDAPPSISANDISVIEGNTGFRSANFTVSLSDPSEKPITVNYATSDGTATAGSDYTANSGTITFNPGQTANTISVLYNGDNINEPDETFKVDLSSPQNATLARPQGTATIVNDDTPIVRLLTGGLINNENVTSGIATVTVTRTGDSSIPVTVKYSTSDQSGLTPCQTNSNGFASERCDYVTAAGTLRFAAGETVKTIQIPLINDAYVEPDESFTVTLSNPQGATLGLSTVNVIIKSEDTQPSTVNPIDDQAVFIKQQYIDFLGRVAETDGFNFWMNRMNQCTPGQVCDRIDTSQRFFQSDEFQERGFYVYRLYDAVLGRLPKYVEFVPDVARLNGPQTMTEQRLGKDAYLLDFMNKQEFRNLYGQYLSTDLLLATDAAGFVNALCATAKITPASKQTLIDNLQNCAKDPAHTLEDFILTPEMSSIGSLYYDRGFITMQYFGYLRRDSDAGGFQFWVNQLIGPNAQHRQDYRFMVGGFLQSDEYRFRFAMIPNAP
jgi:hypothetical protein